MFLYNVMVVLFAVLCVILIPLILMQKGKSSMGFGSMGGGTQLLFGGSGGQDLFQKATWVMGALFMGGSLILAIMKRPAQSRLIGTMTEQTTAPIIPVPSAEKPTPQ